MQLLSDIYGVHKAFKFGQLQRTAYEFDEFCKDIESADNHFFGDEICGSLISGNENQFNISLYPLYLINDNLFDVMTCHFAVSMVVNEMVRNWKNVDGLHVRSVVVPAAICSKYDIEDEYKMSIDDIERFLNAQITKKNSRISRRVDVATCDVPELANLLMNMISLIQREDTMNIAIAFNRYRDIRDTEGAGLVHVFECADWSEMDELNKNYCISFDFCVTAIRATNKVAALDGDHEVLVRCWLRFGLNQRLRFYPEYAVWIIPQLFFRSTMMTTHKMVQKLYHDDYKHGWRVNLEDKVFNKYYHIITGYEHISNNYHRGSDMQKVQFQKMLEGILLRDHLEANLKGNFSVNWMRRLEDQAYDSDSILQDVIYTKDSQEYVEVEESNIMRMVSSQNANLRALKFSILRFENLECKMGAARHIDDCEYIESVIENLQKFQECGLDIDAVSVIHFDLESIINGFDHIIQVHDFLFDDAKKVEIQNFIAQRIACPLGVDCDILRKHSGRVRERSRHETMEQPPLHEVDVFCDAVSDAFYSIHCYILHRDEHLYRLMGTGKSKFQTRFATHSLDFCSKYHKQRQYVQQRFE